MEVQSLSVVVPVFNEGGVIEKVLRDYHAKLAGKVPDIEFIVAEDGSTDNTKEILRGLEKELNLRLVLGDERKGYTGAVKDALRLPTKEWVLFSDSDGQQEPDDFFEMAKLAPRFDLIVGAKTPRRDPLGRVLLSRGLGMLNRALLGATYRDVNCGFRLIRRSIIDPILDKVHLLPQFINAEFVLRAKHMGYRVTEIPVRHYARTEGGSRGLPPSKIPMEIRRLVTGLLEMRREFRDDDSNHSAQ